MSGWEDREFEGYPVLWLEAEGGHHAMVSDAVHSDGIYATISIRYAEDDICLFELTGAASIEDAKQACEEFIASPPPSPNPGDAY